MSIILKPLATRQLIKLVAAGVGIGVGVGSGPDGVIGGKLHGRMLPATNTEFTASLVGLNRKLTVSPAQRLRLLALVRISFPLDSWPFPVLLAN